MKDQFQFTERMFAACNTYKCHRQHYLQSSSKNVRTSALNKTNKFEFIDKQPMKAGQDLKSSLATQKHRKKMTHIHTNETVKTENEFILKGCISGQKQTRLSKEAQ